MMYCYFYFCSQDFLVLQLHSSTVSNIYIYCLRKRQSIFLPDEENLNEKSAENNSYCFIKGLSIAGVQVQLLTL